MAGGASWVGHTVVDRDGNKLGKLDGVYRRHGSDEVTWGVVKHGVRGKRHFVPLSEDSLGRDRVRVSASKSQIQGAPTFDEREEMSPGVEAQLHRHYHGESDGRNGHDRAPSRREVIEGARERQREEFGGFNIGAAFFGWLVATGIAVLSQRSSAPPVERSGYRS